MKSIIASLLLTVSLVSPALALNMTQSVYLDVDEKFFLQWGFDNDSIVFTVIANTTGWLGLGFSPNGGMAGADIVTGWVKDGKTVLQDRHSEKNGFPPMDDSQDYTLISGSEADGQTTLKFSRKHNTCDDKDMVIGTDTMRVIWAMSPDNSDPAANDPSYHSSHRGTRSVYLRLDQHPQNMPSDAFNADYTVKNVSIPTYHTLYHCELMRAPNLTEKHHIVKVEPLIQEDNLGIVHHIILYGCYDDIDREHYFANQTTAYNCFNGNMPNDIGSCRLPVLLWAIGGGEYYYPDEAGFPMGTDKSPKYFMIEIHYDNPQLVQGKYDNSGLRMVLSKQLRQYDASVLPTGAVGGIAAPPEQKDFVHSAFCTGNCTKATMPADGVNIFGIFLHGHLAAKKIIARHFRKGQELELLDADFRYDFNYQQYKMVKPYRKLMPGDDVMVSCHYDTSDRSSMTYGGLPSTSEMCIAYLHYYPAQDAGECYTATPMIGAQDFVAQRYFNLSSKGWRYDFRPEGKDHSRNLYENITQGGLGGWTSTNVDIINDLQYDFQLEMCRKASSKTADGVKFFDVYYPPAAARVPATPKSYDKECPTTPAQPTVKATQATTTPNLAVHRVVSSWLLVATFGLFAILR